MMSSKKRNMMTKVKVVDAVVCKREGFDVNNISVFLVRRWRVSSNDSIDGEGVWPWSRITLLGERRWRRRLYSGCRRSFHDERAWSYRRSETHLMTDVQMLLSRLMIMRRNEWWRGSGFVDGHWIRENRWWEIVSFGLGRRAWNRVWRRWWGCWRSRAMRRCHQHL